MPITKSSFVWTSVILLLIGFVALIGIVGTSFWLVQRSGTFFDEVVEARDARVAAIALRSALRDMETGQRGYLLTGDDKYLEPYSKARDTVMADYEELRKLLLPYPKAVDAMERMGAAVRDKVAELEQTIALRRDGKTDEALDIVRTDRGKQAMDESRQVLDAIVAAADRRSEAGVTDQRQNAQALRLVTILGGLVILLVVGGAVVMALRYTGELLAARGELEVLNRQLEERVAERTQDLMRANEEIQRFAYIVTHDLRAPLVNIMGFTSELDQTMKVIQAYVLADEKPLGAAEIHDARVAAKEDLPEAIGFIRSSTRKMDGLINAILKISREGQRQLKPERIVLSEVLGGAANAVHHQVAETGGEVRIDAGIPPIVTDRLSLEQVVGNLLDNAVKYRAPERPAIIDIRARPEGLRRVRIDVKDNGRGINPEDHQRVFDLFRRSGTQDQPGEGIGLAHVRTLVRNLGGEISLRSEPGAGTTFSIVLPADLNDVKRSAAS
jgi:signal transduction histidine kinase